MAPVHESRRESNALRRFLGARVDPRRRNVRTRCAILTAPPHVEECARGADRARRSSRRTVHVVVGVISTCPRERTLSCHDLRRRTWASSFVNECHVKDDPFAEPRFEYHREDSSVAIARALVIHRPWRTCDHRLVSLALCHDHRSCVRRPLVESEPTFSMSLPWLLLIAKFCPPHPTPDVRQRARPGDQPPRRDGVLV